MDSNNLPAIIKIKGFEHSNYAWYQNHIGEVFNVAGYHRRPDGRLMYEVDISHLGMTTSLGFVDPRDAVVGEFYKCPDCGWIGAEEEMSGDSIAPATEDGDEIWTNWACPQCETWHQLEDYEKLPPLDKQ